MTIDIDGALAERLAAVHRAESALRRAADDGGAIAGAAAESLEALLLPLRAAILHHCPSVNFIQEADTSIARLGFGEILWTWSVPVGVDCWSCESDVRPAFAVAAHAEIGVKMLSDPEDDPGQTHQPGDRGRVHSLWYCDAFEADRFEWAEIGFVVTQEDGGLFHGEGIAPAARAPGPRVAASLSSRGGTLRLGYPLVDLSSAGARRGFVERWLGWFADACLKEYRRGMMVPIDPELGSWRRS